MQMELRIYRRDDLSELEWAALEEYTLAVMRKRAEESERR